MNANLLKRGLLAMGIAGTFALSVSAPASAMLLAYDPFNVGGGPAEYAAGDENAGTDVLAGQTPAPGPTAFYSGGWVQSGGDTQAVQDVPGLAYPDFPQSGGLVTDSVQFACCSFGRNGREIAGGLGGGGARTIYQSFLIDFGTQGTDAATDFGKRAYEMWNGGIGDSLLALDLFVNHFAGVNQLTLAVTTASGTVSALVSGGGLTLDELAKTNSGVHLMVLKFEFNPLAPDLVTLFLDPLDSIEASNTPAVALAVAASDLFFTHHGTISNFTFSGSGHVPGRFDELRWGDTFADVTPFLTAEVPEPPALGLFVAGLLGVALLRRRQAAGRTGSAR